MAGECLLVVDDHPVNLKLMRVLLSNEGYEVHTAVDAEEAVVKLQSLRPRLILMDLQLPGMDGYALTRQLKADARTRHIAIVAVTSYAMRGDEELALAAGCDSYISKPIDVATLPALLAAHLAAQDRGRA